jgi:DNA-binding SARP family transcriptional activator
MPRQRDEITIGVVGRFSLVCNGTELAVPPAAQRPLAFLATATRPVSRMTMAGRIWPYSHTSDALDKLRKAVWRVNTLTRDPVLVNRTTIQFATYSTVDLRQAREAATQLFDGVSTHSASLCADLFEEDILIDWDDDWLEDHRHRYHLLRLHALEHLAQRFLSARKLIDAERTCLSVVRDDPLRETARLLLAEIYLSQKHPARAIHGLNEYRTMMESQLGLKVSHELQAAIDSIGPIPARSHTGASDDR